MKKIEELKKAMCNDYAPYCGCGCRVQHCPIEKFANNLESRNYIDIIEFVNKLKVNIHNDDFEQLCQDCSASEDDVFNYIDNTLKEFLNNE